MLPCSSSICSHRWRFDALSFCHVGPCSYVSLQSPDRSSVTFTMGPNCPGRGYMCLYMCLFLPFAKSPNSRLQGLKTGSFGLGNGCQTNVGERKYSVCVGLKEKQTKRILKYIYQNKRSRLTVCVLIMRHRSHRCVQILAFKAQPAEEEPS